MKKIALIVPYFGSFREDFSFWLKSMEHNPTIDCLLFTDQRIDSYPANIKLFSVSITDIEKLVKKYVFSDAILPRPYKLCDYKPAYGEIFQDYLLEYDFWGHCDIDLIFGDIRHFFTDEILNRYDRFLTRGHLTLYRNTTEVNQFYRKVDIPNFKDVYTSLNGFAFDEWAGTSMYWHKNNSTKLYDEIIFDDVAAYHYPFFSYQKKDSDNGKRYFMFSYDSGKLYRYYEFNGQVIKEETLYAHFQKRKLEVKTCVADRFTIIPNKIIAYEDNITTEYLKRKVGNGRLGAYKHRILSRLDTLLGINRRYSYLPIYKRD